MRGPPTIALAAVSLMLQLLHTPSHATECVRQQHDQDSFVCVCDGQTCDFPGPTVWPDANSYTVYSSTRDSHRLTLVSTGAVDRQPDLAAKTTITINTTETKSEIFGFGGAFTDSTGIGISSLNKETQEQLMRSYFSPEGLEYNLCRIPIAGADCSTRPYSYDDVEGDVELKHWSLRPEDHLYKLPYIRQAIELASSEILFFGSPWSPPSWMKTNGMFNGSGQLLPQMWQPWSNYFVKFVESYEAEGVPLWGLTTQNEPGMGFYANYPFNTCGWTATDMRDWISSSLGPTLSEAGMRRLKLMIVDEARDMLPDFPKPMLDDPDCSQYVDGIAVHWYRDDQVGPEVLIQTHDLDPSKFLLYTEACEGNPGKGVLLGSWSRGEHYLTDIIENLNYLSSGWVDWNLVLDTTGGPNWADNLLDAPIIADQEQGVFYKQPTFYAMGHVSKFLKRGAFIQGTTTSSANLRATSATNPDGTIVMVVVNIAEVPESVSIGINNERFVNTELPPKSFQTFLISGTSEN